MLVLSTTLFVLIISLALLVIQHEPYRRQLKLNDPRSIALKGSVDPSSLKEWERRLQQWNSPRCQFAHVMPPDGTASSYIHEPPSLNSQSRLRIPPTITLDDLCKHKSGNSTGRLNAFTPTHDVTEMVVVPKLKIAYLVTRKAGSSTINNVLKQAFRVTPNECPGMNRSETESAYCNAHSVCNRCSTACLTDDQLKEYFFFSSVRDPVTRFYSSIKQSFVMGHDSRKRKYDDTFDLDEIREFLQKMRDNRCGADHHLETQAAVLSSFTSSRNNRVPIDYIIRLENFENDMNEMFEIAEAYTGLAMNQDERASVNDWLGRSINPSSGSKFPYESNDLDALIRETYHQDMACFGTMQ